MFDVKSLIGTKLTSAPYHSSLEPVVEAEVVGTADGDTLLAVLPDGRQVNLFQLTASGDPEGPGCGPWVVDFRKGDDYDGDFSS